MAKQLVVHIYQRVKSFAAYNFMLYCNYFVLLALSFSLNTGAVLLNFLPVLIAYLIVGLGAFVFNDLHDMDADRQAGKPNITEVINPKAMKVMIGLIILAGFALASLVSVWILLLLTIQVLLLILYSVPAIRFKEKGIVGILTDAAYAHLIPEVMLVVFINIYLDTLYIPIFFLLFNFTIGLRDILIHQLADVENDLRGGGTSYATVNKKSAVKLAGFFDKLLLPLFTALLIEIYYRSNQVFLVAIALVVVSGYLLRGLVAKKQSDPLISIYIVCSSFILAYVAIVQASFFFILLLIHPYFVSFLRSKLHALFIWSRYTVKLILGFMLITLIPLLVNHILYYLFRLWGRDLKKHPLYSKQHEPYFFTKIRNLFN